MTAPAATDGLPASDAAPLPTLSPAGRLLVAIIGLYQRTATLRAPRCRFHPTCSQYAVDSLRVHGAVRGLGHALARVGRCHPWHPGGPDPVKPPTVRKK